MIRGILSVLTGAVSWTVLWVFSARLVFALVPSASSAVGPGPTSPLDILFFGLSIVYSVVAGYITAALANRYELRHSLALGVLQLGLGLYFQISNWDSDPIWYHIGFLLCLLPATLAGGWLRSRVRRAYSTLS
jgi:hypothetical protein